MHVEPFGTIGHLKKIIAELEEKGCIDNYTPLFSGGTSGCLVVKEEEGKTTTVNIDDSDIINDLGLPEDEVEAFFEKEMFHDL